MNNIDSAPRLTQHKRLVPYGAHPSFCFAKTSFMLGPLAAQIGVVGHIGGRIIQASVDHCNIVGVERQGGKGRVTAAVGRVQACSLGKNITLTTLPLIYTHSKICFTHSH